MTEVKSWLATVCCGALICGLVSVLCPTGQNRRVLNIVLGMFMLCCFLLPAGMDLGGLSADTREAEESRRQAADELNDYFFQRTAEKSQQEIEEIIYSRLAQYGIKRGEAEIYIDTDEQNGQRSVVVTVRLPQRLRAHHDEIAQVLEYELGCDTRLEYIKEQ